MKIPINWLNQIVNLPKDTKLLTEKLTMIGHMLDKIEVVDGQTVIDLELRGNRADCYSIMGIAREVAAISNGNIKTQPEIKVKQVKKLNTNLSIKSPLVKRAMITQITGVKIEKSPKWLSQKLELYGMESVNNIVDLTNYVMIETGQPMHAFDNGKLSKDLQVRLAKHKERIITFQNSSITLTKDDLVWTMGEKVIAIAGGIGEKYHSISNDTTNILVEAANYDRASIRKTIYRHKLLTESGIRQEKELDPNMVESAIGRFLYLIQKNGWGKFDSKVYDYYPKKINPWKIKLDLNNLFTIGGVEITNATIKKILSNLNFKIISFTKNDIELLVPTYRTDVTLPEDLIEEILRIYGYDKIPSNVLSLEIPKQITPEYIIQESKAREAAAAVGFSEAITLSFVKKAFSSYNLNSEKAQAQIVELINPPSPDNQNLRMTLLSNLFELSQKAINLGSSDVQLFELGKIYYKYKGKYVEERKCGFVFQQIDKNSFAKFKSKIDSFFSLMGISSHTLNPEALLLPLTNSYEIYAAGKKVGVGGKIKNIYFAEIDLDKILGTGIQYKITLWPKYPPQIEDVTFYLPDRTLLGEVAKNIKSINLVKNCVLSGSYQNNYFTFKIWYQHPEKTLTNSEVEEARTNIVNLIKDKFEGKIKD